MAVINEALEQAVAKWKDGDAKGRLGISLHILCGEHLLIFLV